MLNLSLFQILLIKDQTTNKNFCLLWFNFTVGHFSAIYSDGTNVKFPNLDLLPGTQAMGS